MVAYLDNNSTTQCAPEVVEAMLPFFAGKHGNAASPHVFGREAARAVARAREQVAECVDCDPAEIYFTSCATEANNLAILGLARRPGARCKIVTSAIEHKSVLGPCESLVERGYEVTVVPVSKGGIIDLDAARAAIDDRTLMVTVQGANNEVGTLQPIRALAEIAHERGAVMHCDAAQLLGKIPVSVASLGADLVSFSSHKAYGPKGIGFLVSRGRVGGVPLSPIQFGGGQENGMRPGTVNVPGAVGAGESCRLCQSRAADDARRVQELRSLLEVLICRAVPGARVLAADSPRLPGTSSVLFPGVAGDLLVARTPSVCMGLGSACTSGAVAPSHVLLALGLSSDEARATVRLSLGRYTSRCEVEQAVDAIGESVGALHAN